MVNIRQASTMDAQVTLRSHRKKRAFKARAWLQSRTLPPVPQLRQRPPCCNGGKAWNLQAW